MAPPRNTASRARTIEDRMELPKIHAIIERCAREALSPADKVVNVIRQVKTILAMEVEAQNKMVTRRAATTQPFWLFELPAELWSRIGELVIQDTEPCTESSLALPTTIPGLKDYFRGRCAKTQQPSITRTCRVLRAELLPLYYRTKIDVVGASCSAGCSEEAGKWLHAIGAENRGMISGVTVWVHNICRHESYQEEAEAGIKNIWGLDVALEMKCEDTDRQTYQVRFLE